MKDAFSPLKDSLYFKDLFIRFADDPLLGVLVGMVFTVLLQSSSATIAIVQVLAFNGIIGFQAALPIIVGGNIGTTITAQLAAIGTNVTARRAAMSHTLFNVIGVGYTMIFLYTGWFARGVEWAIPGVVTPKNVMFYLAVSHSVFNVVNTIVFLPFIGLLEKVSVWLVPQHKGAIDMRPQYLEKHLLDTPPIALEQAKQETVRMLSLAKQSVSTAVFSFITPNAGAGKSVEQLEEAVDNLQSEITQYLIELSQRSLAEAETEEIPVLIHSVNDIERIGDHSENIIDLVSRKEEERLPFSDSAFTGLSQMWNTLLSMMEKTESALHQGDIAVAHEVLALEEQINQFQKDLKRGHVERLGRGECQIKSGIIFMDMVDNLEKIGDHLTNIAQAVIGELRWHESKSAVFL